MTVDVATLPTATKPARRPARWPVAIGGVVVLAALTAVAKAGHWVLHEVPAPVWALLAGIVGGEALRRHRALAPVAASVPYDVPLLVGLVLLGAQVSVAVFESVGAIGVAAIGGFWVAVALAFALTVRLRLLPWRTASLLALGLSGCGVSAIAAAAARDPESAGTPQIYATVTVLVLGALGLIVMPIIGGALGLDSTEFGAWAGLTVANAAEAVAAGAVHSDDAMRTAAAYKLLVNAAQGFPIVAFLLFANRRGDHVRLSARDAAFTIVTRVPPFVWGFALVALIATLGFFDDGERRTLGNVTSWAFLIALVGVGLKTRVVTLREQGLRPFLIAAAVTMLLTAIALIPFIA